MNVYKTLIRSVITYAMVTTLIKKKTRGRKVIRKMLSPNITDEGDMKENKRWGRDSTRLSRRSKTNKGVMIGMVWTPGEKIHIELL